eukprot:TRINITY_DN2991_c0_g1_i1.p1 TRINITY_DN2991_c0_g1~~TRINITY_DN2991_c0_g1_i1.p1  ORF type:complete len:302 (-),score=53.66 TRINITY_DN2991_c0_g1_i1:31-936(-)
MKYSISMLSLFVIVAIMTVDADYCGPWPVEDVHSLPAAKAGDDISITYLVAPLLYCSYKDEATHINGYHGGIGFTNRRTNFSITLNYDAYPEFMNAIVPEITKLPNGTVDLKWGNFGKVFIYEGINNTYWHSVNQLVGHMSGSQYNKFINEFVAGANDTFTFYNAWRVYDKIPGKLLMDNYECFNFVWDCFEAVQEYGGIIFPDLHLRQSFATMFSAYSPKKVNMDNPSERDEVVAFWEIFEGKFKDLGVIGTLVELFELVIEGSFYVRNGNSYYHVILHYPYAGMEWIEVPVPIVNQTRF